TFSASREDFSPRYFGVRPRFNYNSSHPRRPQCPFYVIFTHQAKMLSGADIVREEDGSKAKGGAEYEVDIIINTKYKFIDIGQNVVKYLCGLIRFDEDTTHWIILAVREGISKAIKHGNQCDENKKVRIRLTYARPAFDISIEDQGAGFDPAQVKNPLLP